MDRTARSGRLLRRALPIGFVLGVWGCALIANVDFDDAHPTIDPSTIEGGPFFGEGGASTNNGCPPDQKPCNGACVSKRDVAYGCGASECAPCSLAHSVGATCGLGNTCIPQACEPGFDDCNHDPANGCETDLLRPESCGSCTTKCAGGMFCAPAGCVAACPSPLVPCSGSCVDTASSVAHCGGCNQPCPAATNADQLCSGGVCGIGCRAGFGDCANTPPKACAALQKWYVDDDHDEYGTGVFMTACTRPAGHAPNTGDCLDSNAAVHPLAGPSDVPYAGPNGPSYDYDCSGTETEENAPVHFAGCAVSCSANGYIPVTPARGGAGVDNYCGSPTRHVCFVLPPPAGGGGCTQIDYDGGVRIMCR